MYYKYISFILKETKPISDASPGLLILSHIVFLQHDRLRLTGFYH